uniref:DUF4283 domain-containing protein n=1 Tax=Ananas comosus var. bracteatus TaxID=296719 RepID=A0A6V7QCD1_ANACO|nr:unnamed protein product [Ananas comosus var. bracteatus]
MRGRGEVIQGRRVEGRNLLPTALLDKSGKRKEPQKRVAWADEVGRELLQVFRGRDEAEESLAASSKGDLREHKNPLNGYQQRRATQSTAPPEAGPQAKVYVPFTEEYLRRVELRRNALLADVIPPANLGPDPINTIKSALARRFGGYNDDFSVARCRERDFAVFLSEWVPVGILTRREILTLDGFWLRCYPWGQYHVGEVRTRRRQRPPGPPRLDHDEAGGPAEDRNPARQADGDDAGMDEEMGDAPGELEQAEPAPQEPRPSGLRSVTRRHC